jgi:hypothetical protein
LITDVPGFLPACTSTDETFVVGFSTGGATGAEPELGAGELITGAAGVTLAELELPDEVPVLLVAVTANV